MKLRSTLALSATLITGAQILAAIELAPIYSDNMILQREVPIPLCGTAETEQSVTVYFNGAQYSGTVVDGRWQIKLPAMPAGGSYEIVVTGAEHSITLENVTFGDIWLCAGQSNMDSIIETYKSKFPELYEGHPVKQHDQIRIFRTERLPIDEPQEFITREHRFQKGWYRIEPSTKTRLFSATGYFFGLYLAQATDVPIGLIHSCRGGTPITAWMPPYSLEAREGYRHILEAYEQSLLDWPSTKIQYESKVVEWEAKKANGETVGWRPEPPLGPISNKRPYALHNGMIAPLYKFPIKGVLWYQGEGNSRTRKDSVQYEALLKDLVSLWRDNWDNQSLPFLVVQLPGFGKASAQPNLNHNWPWIRESQKNIDSIKNCQAVCIIDSGMEKDIHPPYKENVGKRLAYAARSLVYGHTDAPQSPEYSFHVTDRDSTIITFKNVGSGLTTKAPLIKESTYQAGEVLGFTVINAKGNYERVRGRILAPDKVEITHPGKSAPTSIRYGWDNFPNVNLYGPADMPAFPFRTDDLSPFKQ